MRSPRLLFEYHFFPNLAVIVLCNAVLIQRLYGRFKSPERNWYLGGYAVVVVLMFAYFYPILAGVPVTYETRTPAGSARPTSARETRRARRG